MQKTDVLVFSMGSFIAQELTLLHPEKINWLIHYGELCGEKENLPQDTQVLRIQKKSVGFVLLL
jgi:pimeloyl-ACP methyl ester carboxylesterase